MQSPGTFLVCAAKEADVERVVPLGQYEEDSRNARLHKKVDKAGARVEDAIGKPKSLQIIISQKARRHEAKLGPSV